MPFKAAELRLTFKGVEKATWNSYEEIKKPAKTFGKQVVASKANHQFIKFETTIHTFEKQTSPVGQREYPFTVKLPEWLPSSFLLQSDFTKHGRREVAMQYRLYARMVPASARRTP